ncbi:MAG: hypothetical protein K8J08_08160, partial [Thermoanaerobaculia bacterium]|nr:hypothetical protein [Thermoanaerobaculia bacterium]
MGVGAILVVIIGLLAWRRLSEPRRPDLSPDVVAEVQSADGSELAQNTDSTTPPGENAEQSPSSEWHEVGPDGRPVEGGTNSTDQAPGTLEAVRPLGTSSPDVPPKQTESQSIESLPSKSPVDRPQDNLASKSPGANPSGEGRDPVKPPGRETDIKVPTQAPYQAPTRAPTQAPTQAPDKTPTAVEEEPEPAIEDLPVDKILQTSISLRFDVDPDDTFVLFKEVTESRFISIGRAEEWSGKKDARVFELPGPGEYYVRFRRSGRREVTYRLVASHGAGATPIVLRMP